MCRLLLTLEAPRGIQAAAHIAGTGGGSGAAASRAVVRLPVIRVLGACIRNAMLREATLNADDESIQKHPIASSVAGGAGADEVASQAVAARARRAPHDVAHIRESISSVTSGILAAIKTLMKLAQGAIPKNLVYGHICMQGMLAFSRHH